MAGIFYEQILGFIVLAQVNRYGVESRRIKKKEESPGPLSTETKLLGHCEAILVLKSTLFHS